MEIFETMSLMLRILYQNQRRSLAISVLVLINAHYTNYAFFPSGMRGMTNWLLLGCALLLLVLSCAAGDLYAVLGVSSTANPKAISLLIRPP